MSPIHPLRRSLIHALPWGAALCLALVSSGCEGRRRHIEPAAYKAPPTFSGPRVVELDLSRGVPESATSSFFGAVSRRNHLELVRTLGSFAEDERNKGLYVRFGLSQIGMARAHEIGRLLGAIRTAGKPVVCHAEDYNNATMLLAALGCSKIWLSPAGEVSTVGLAAQLLFANRLLGKLNVEADFLQAGKYKGAMEPFMRDGPSPEARESLEGTLRGMRTAWMDGISQGRGDKSVAELLEDGPYTAGEAKAHGLVHELGYADEARDDAKKAAGTEFSVTRFGSPGPSSGASGGFIEVLRSLSGSGSAGTPHIAVVPAIGGISMSAGDGLPFGGSEGIGERELGRLLTEVMDDESALAVVLRIDSPGGSALASDLLWKKLMELREKKPLIVSVGGMAASGGYYMACAGTKIVAEPTSIVGSIGVVTGKLSVGKALEELGVHAETVAATSDPKRAARATYMSPLTPWDEATRAKMKASVDSIYDLFIRRITEGRNMAREDVERSAEGRIYSGTEAKERGMIDELGGLGEALALARALAKLPDDTPVELRGNPPVFGDLFGVSADEADEEARLKQAAASLTYAPGADWIGRIAQKVPEISVWMSAMSPLLLGERNLAVLPYTISIR